MCKGSPRRWSAARSPAGAAGRCSSATTAVPSTRISSPATPRCGRCFDCSTPSAQRRPRASVRDAGRQPRQGVNDVFASTGYQRKRVYRRGQVVASAVASDWSRTKRPRGRRSCSQRRGGANGRPSERRLLREPRQAGRRPVCARSARVGPAEDRRRLRVRARRLRLGDRDQATTPQHLTFKPLGLEQRMRPTTRRTLEASM
jgi:hypothetical protein